MLNLLLIIAVATSALATSVLPINPALDGEWLEYKKSYNKVYAEEEDERRRGIWEENLVYIRKHNIEADRGAHTFWLGMNKYGDMTNKEFAKAMNHFKPTNKTSGSAFLPPSHVTLPDSVDWRTEGYVTGVKDQGQCGSCWAFSATGSLEGQHFKKTGQLVSLSEQNLMDCSRPDGNLGCEGGVMQYAFEYIVRNNGVDTEESYPYEERDVTQCRFNPANVGATCSGYVNIKRGSEADLEAAVATVGPVSVAMNANHKSFQLYKSGIYHNVFCSQTNLDHAVLAVGYGAEDGKDYWLVKNSWGTSWGMDGYAKMSRNRNNNCGIATQACYPTV